MSGAGEVGTFIYEVISVAGDAGCGRILCLLPNNQNPMVSLAGSDVMADVLGAGAGILMLLPAAVWFLLSGLIALMGFGRESA